MEDDPLHRTIASLEATATLSIPQESALIGIPLHNAFVTIKAAAPSGIASISNTFSFIVR